MVSECDCTRRVFLLPSMGAMEATFPRRFPSIAAAVLRLPTKSAVIDGELIAAGRDG
jgi:hypothetical protein